jgi:CRISPR-associated protein Csb2
MLAIELTFPTGRYHATPWDAHVNEGVVEWPPAPWRILRALIATRHLKASELVTEEMLEELIGALSDDVPVYALPSGVAGFHTRHYMPVVESGREKSGLVFDTFLHLPGGSRIVVAWPGVDLASRSIEALGGLLDRLGYLGRAETWVEARLCGAEGLEFDCLPLQKEERERATRESDREVVRLLAPLPTAELATWRASALEERALRASEGKRRQAREKGRPESAVKPSAKEKLVLDSSLPQSALDALSAATDVVRKQGWSRPPGSRWVEYVRWRVDARPAPRRARATSELPTVARFAVAGNVLPRLTEGIFEADKIRTVLVSYSNGHPVFGGRDPATGTPLSGHRHAFILPEANRRHGCITHFTIFASMGFDEAARRALDRMAALWQRSGHELQLVLIGMGRPEEFAGTRIDAGECPLLATSDSWISRTPFVPTRHAKHRGNGDPKLDQDGLVIGSPEQDLVRLLADQGFPRPVTIKRVPETNLGGKPTRWLAFRTERKSGGGRRGAHAGVGYRLVFPTPVRGPIAVGYGAHFGLGCFIPAP